MALYYGNNQPHHVQNNGEISNKLDMLVKLVSEQSSTITKLKKLGEDNASTILQLNNRLDSIEKAIEKSTDGVGCSFRSASAGKIPRQLSVRHDLYNNS